MKRLLTAICFLCLAFIANPSSAGIMDIHELGIGGGYMWGDLKDDNPNRNHNVTPFFIHIGWRINSTFGLDEHKGDIQFALEPFYNRIHEPKDGYEAGATLFLKYSYPLSDFFVPYAELGSGPMYLSIETNEQGNAGFNFLNQGGIGVHLMIDVDKSVNLGYRFRHISHADTRNAENAGIDTQGGYIGFSLHY